jgi:hypothetical protein
MCISLKWSLTTYVFGLLGSIMLLFSKNVVHKFFGIFMTYIFQMQLLEAIMWYDQECKEGGLNYISSIIAYFFTILQPIVANLIAYYIIKDVKILVGLIPFILYSAYFAYKNYPNKQELCTKPCNGHLTWNWLKFNWWNMYGCLWYIYVLLPFFYLIFNCGNHATTIIVYSYIFLTATYTFKHYVTKSAPSLWCILQLATPYIALAIQ